MLCAIGYALPGCLSVLPQTTTDGSAGIGINNGQCTALSRDAFGTAWQPHAG
ncbi:hypothetical protein [Parapedobacter sp.]